MANPKQNWQHSLWHSNIFTVFLLALLLLSFIKVAKEVLLRYEIKREISSLEGQLADLQAKSEKTDHLIAYLKTDEYIEKQAREKLNLAQVGERQINLVGDEAGLVPVMASSSSSGNVAKWFDYFFN